MARYFSFPVFALVLMTNLYTCSAFFDGISSIVGIAFFAFSLLYPKDQVESEDEKVAKGLDIETERLMNKLKHIIARDNQIYDLTRDIQEEIHRVPKLVLLETSMNDFSTAISIIDSHFNDFLLYRHYLSRKPVLTLETFSNFVLNRLDDYLLDIHAQFVPNKYGTNAESTIPHLLNNYMQHFRGICNKNKSMNYILYQLYVAVTMIEIKSYIMKRFAYEIRETYYGSNHYTDRQLLDRKLEDRHRERRIAFIEAMKQSSRSVWTCEPDESSVFIFRQYRPVYVPNSIDLEHFSPFCRYNKNKLFNPRDLQIIRDEAARQRVPLGCKGNFKYCGPADVDVCLARRYSPKNNLLPYERLYLRPEQCHKENPNYIDVFPHTYKMDYCLCACQENVLTLINAAPVYSDYENNRVITGARFSKRELGPQTVELFLEIREGELLANGTINPKTLVWKRNKEVGESLIRWPSAKVNLFAQDWTDIDHVFSFMRNDGKPVPTVLTGLELVVFTDKDSTSITLVSHMSGAILHPPRVYEGFPKPSSHFVLPEDPHDIRNTNVTKFYPFKTLNRQGEYDKRANVKNLNMKNRDVFKTSRSSAIDSYYNEYLTFEFTDIEKDLGQSIVPFIDMQSVITDPPVPLAGAALYHKGTEGHGGYVGLELRTFDFGKYLV